MQLQRHKLQPVNGAEIRTKINLGAIPFQWIMEVALKLGWQCNYNKYIATAYKLSVYAAVYT